jgi:hypothetical protein
VEHAREPSIPRFWIITTLSTGFAIVLYRSSYPTLVYDAITFYRNSQGLILHGLAGAAYEYKTCGYPLFIAICSIFHPLPPEAVRPLVFAGQQGVFLVACAWAARSLGRVFRRRGFATVFYGSAVLNPFLLARVAEFLSDILAAILVLVALVLSVRPTRRPVAAATAALACAALAVLVRPANMTILFSVVLLWTVRGMLAKSLPPRALPLLLVATLTPFLPQVWINLRAYGKLEPLVVARLYRDQTRWGMKDLKYATIVVHDQRPEMAYSNPLYLGDPSPKEFMRRNPLAYLGTLGLHLFAMFDQDFLFTYVTDLHPWYRWPLAALNLAFLLLAVWGIGHVRWTWSSRESFAAAAILLTSLFYVAIHLPIAVESRYSAPVDLLLTPFFAIALLRLRELWKSGSRRAIARLSWAILLFTGAGLVLSGWISLQAPPLAGVRALREDSPAALRTHRTTSGAARRRNAPRGAASGGSRPATPARTPASRWSGSG